MLASFGYQGITVLYAWCVFRVMGHVLLLPPTMALRKIGVLDQVLASLQLMFNEELFVLVFRVMAGVSSPWVRITLYAFGIQARGLCFSVPTSIYKGRHLQCFIRVDPVYARVSSVCPRGGVGSVFPRFGGEVDG